MIDISFDKNPILYKDYEACQKMLSTIKNEDYEYPKNITLFHIYTEFRTDKEVECLKSFLATQNLDKCKLIIWSDYDINDNPLIQKYKKYLDLRLWDAKKEAVGTILEGIPHLDAIDDKHYLQSDLLRILVLYKYGGVWGDMDIIFLRDFRPILDQEYMYQWGGDTDFTNQGACATVLSGFKESEFMFKLLEGIVDSRIIPATTIWGKDLFATLWKKWPKFTIFPSPFFNTEWLISKKDVKLSEDVESGWFINNGVGDKYLFLESFAWHWHNSSKKHLPIQEGSKFYALQQLTNKRLIEKGIL